MFAPLAQKGAANIDNDQHGAPASRLGQDLIAQVAQEGTLSALRIAKNVHVRLVVEVESPRLQAAFFQTQHDPLLRTVNGLDLRDCDLLRQQAQARTKLGRGSNANKGRLDTFTDRLRIMDPIGARQGNKHVVTRHRQTATRAPLGDLASLFTAELRIRRITHAQLKTRTENILHLKTEVHLAQCGCNEVDTEGERALSHEANAVFRIGEVAS